MRIKTKDRNPEDEQKIKKLLYVISSLEKNAVALVKAVNNCQTTKEDVNDVAKKIERTAECSILNNLIGWLEIACPFGPVRKRGVDISVQTNSIHVQDYSTQTYESMKPEVDYEAKENIWNAIIPENSFDQAKPLLDKRWPNDAFRNVRQVSTELPKLGDGALAFSFMNDEQCCLGGAPQLHIGRMTEEDLKARAGKVAHLKSEISLSGEETEVRRHAFCLFTKKESGKADLLRISYDLGHNSESKISNTAEWSIPNLYGEDRIGK